MNWNQIFASATREERLILTIKMIETLEARQRRFVIVGFRFIRNRRRRISPYPYHYVGGDRRSPLPQWKQSFRKIARHVSIVLSIGALTGGVATLAVSVSALQALLIILSYQVAVVTLLYFKRKFIGKFQLLVIE